MLNEVVANQVLVSFGDRTPDVVGGIQADGTCWCGGTTWRGRPAMRISVSSWRTTDDDVERSLEAMVRVAGAVLARPPEPGGTGAGRPCSGAQGLRPTRRYAMAPTSSA